MPELKLSRETLWQSPKVVLMSLAGQMGADNGMRAEQYFDTLAREDQPRHVLLDLRGLTFAGSAFASALLFWRAKLARQGGQLVLFGLRPAVASTLRILGLDQVMTIRADQPSALEALSKEEDRHAADLQER
jgi:anti-anti-sigma factor